MRIELPNVELTLREGYTDTTRCLAQWDNGGGRNVHGLTIYGKATDRRGAARELIYRVYGTVGATSPRAWLHIAQTSVTASGPGPANLQWCEVHPCDPSAFAMLRLVAELKGERGASVRFDVGVSAIEGGPGKLPEG